ncbi:MAG: tetratricopeptide repeat protein [Candidatus Omnitrophota bacterium]
MCNTRKKHLFITVCTAAVILFIVSANAQMETSVSPKKLLSDLDNYRYLTQTSNVDQKIEKQTKIIEAELGRNRKGNILKEAYLKRSTLYTMEKRYQAALADLKKALEIIPDDYVIYNNIAWTYYNLGDYHTALEHANTAVDLNLHNYFALNTRALIYAKINNFDEALEDLSLAIRYNKKYAFSYFTRGKIYYLQGKNELAQDNFNKAISLERKLKKEITAFKSEVMGGK